MLDHKSLKLETGSLLTSSLPPLASSSNMSRDTELFQQFDISNETKPIFFFYTWDQPAITIGKIQRNREKLMSEAEALGIPCYLRPTGGRAVLHGGDICYTFIGAQSDPEFGGTLQESFKKVNERVIGFVNEAIGLEAGSLKLEKASSLEPPASSFINCFSTHVSNEGLINGHKIIGAAQAMGSRSFIQQGSIQINKIESKLKEFSKTKVLNELIDLKLDPRAACDSLNSLLQSL